MSKTTVITWAKVYGSGIRLTYEQKWHGRTYFGNALVGPAYGIVSDTGNKSRDNAILSALKRFNPSMIEPADPDTVYGV